MDKDALIAALMEGALSLSEVQAFRAKLDRDPDFKQRFITELELQKSLAPEGDYQHFKEQLGKVGGEFFGHKSAD